MLTGFFIVLALIAAGGVAMTEMRDRPMRRAERLKRTAAQAFD